MLTDLSMSGMCIQVGRAEVFTGGTQGIAMFTLDDRKKTEAQCFVILTITDSTDKISLLWVLKIDITTEVENEGQSVFTGRISFIHLANHNPKSFDISWIESNT